MIAITRRTRDELLRRWRAASEAAEHGMSTAEYAVGTIAAVAFAAVLIAIVKSDTVRSALEGIFSSALSTR